MHSVNIVSSIALATVLYATATATCSAAAVGSTTLTDPGLYRNSAGTSITLVAEQDSDRLTRRGCVPPKNGEVNTAIIDANGKIETFVCPNPTGDVTLDFGEQAGVVTPEGTSAIGDVAVGATGVEGALALAGVGAAIGIGAGLGLGGPSSPPGPPVIQPVLPISP
jgi:hypothetical protein